MVDGDAEGKFRVAMRTTMNDPEKARKKGGNHPHAQVVEEIEAYRTLVFGAINRVENVVPVKAMGDETTRPTITDTEGDVSTMCVADRHGGLRRASAADRNRCAAIVADPDVALAERAACAGALPGQPLGQSDAKAVLNLIARSARDLFGSIGAADRFLNGENFDATGMSAKALVSHGRGTAVIARLDELRYGTQG